MIFKYFISPLPFSGGLHLTLDLVPSTPKREAHKISPGHLLCRRSYLGSTGSLAGANQVKNRKYLHLKVGKHVFKSLRSVVGIFFFFFSFSVRSNTEI